MAVGAVTASAASASAPEPTVAAHRARLRVILSDHPSSRFRRPSLRATLALGGAAAVVVSGAIATTDTMAAATDEANAKVSQIATENFYPTPLPSGNPSCSRSGSLGFYRANVSWPSAGQGYAYRLTLLNNAGTSVVWNPWYQTGTSYTFAVNYDIAWADYTLTIQTVNLASGSANESRQHSSGWLTHKVGSNGQRNGTCVGGGGRKANATWEDSSDWTPSSSEAFGRSVAGKPGSIGAESPVTETQTESAAPSETVESADDTEQTATPSAEPSEETTPSTTEQPAPSSTEPAEDDAEVTIGIGVAGDQKALIISRDGEQVCHTPLKPEDKPSINGNTVVIQSGDTVKTVDTTTCALS